MTEERNAYTAVREENGGNLPSADIRAAEKERAGNNRMLKMFARKWGYIVLGAVILALMAALYAAFVRDTVYTAETEVLFAVLELRENDGVTETSPTTNKSLSDKYMPTVEDHIVSPKYVNEADKIYKDGGGTEGSVSSRAIALNYDDDTLVFTISYSDVSASAAEEKLAAVIESANLLLPDYIDATEVELISVQNRADVSEDNGLVKFTVIGFIGGAVLAAIILLAVYLTDNSVKSKDELEEITGAYLVARLTDYDNAKNSGSVKA